MSRTKGSKNKNSSAPSLVSLSPEERLSLLANLIIDRIFEDQKNGQPLLKEIEGVNSAQPTST